MTVVMIQVVFLALFVIDWKVPALATVGFLITMLLLDNPVWAVLAMIAARLSSTGTMSFFTIGKISIGPFEPVLAYALLAFGLKAVFSGKKFLVAWPWQFVFFLIVLWRVLGLAWCLNRTDGIKDIVTMGVIVGTSTVIIGFIDTWDRVKLALWFWLLTCVAVGILAIFGDMIGLTDFSAQWKAAEGGGRETGLGQQPNWFAMNLMFVIVPAGAFALIQKQLLTRWFLIASTIFIFFAAMTSGSRGGAYSIVIGSFLVALGQPLFRTWFLRFAGVGGVFFFIAYFGNLGDIGKGLNRISTNIDTLFARDIRGMNWAACVQMFVDTYGVGIGPGGYVDGLAKYSWWLYNSVYRYPHGIFWSEMVHGGVIGVILFFTLVVVITRMAIHTIQAARGTEAEMLAWAMPASMAGYFAWSFVEFELDEKPFWEWLALYTAFHLVVLKAKKGELPAIPKWSFG